MTTRKLLILLLTMTVVLAAVPAVLADVSSSAVLFLRIAPGARAAGMGEAFVAVADDATATHWNPAGLGAYPLNDAWTETSIPFQLKPIRGMAAQKVGSGSTYLSYDIWAITARGLARYDHKRWHEGEVFSTRTNQTVLDIVGSYFGLEDEEKLNAMARSIATSNSAMSYDALVALADSIRSATPESYSSAKEMNELLDTLVAGYDRCLINWSRVSEARSLYRKGMSDGSLNGEEAEKLLFVVEKSRNRFIPEELTIPYSANIGGDITSIDAIDKILVVGTTAGLVTFNGQRWKTYTTAEGLSSDNVLTLFSIGQNVMVGTETGINRFSGAGLAPVPGADALPSGRVTAIGGESSLNLWAAIDGDLYRTNGTTWSNMATYTVVIDDTKESIAKKFLLYGSQGELDRYIAKMGEVSLEPGTVINVPYTAGFKGKIYSLYSIGGKLSVGTSYGLFTYTSAGWDAPGYKMIDVTEGMTLASIVDQRTRWDNESTRESYTAQLIDINDFDEAGTLTAGTQVAAYANIAATPIHDISAHDGMVYYASSAGLFHDENGALNNTDLRGLHNDRMVGVGVVEAEPWFFTSDRAVLHASGRTSISTMFVKWLPELADDLYYTFMGATFGIGDLGTAGISATYITYGTINRRGETGADLGTFESFDFALTGSFGTALTNNLSGGISAKVIYSKLADQGAGEEQGKGTSTGFAFDFGLLYAVHPRVNLGLALTNFGPKMTYINAEQSDHLPRNLSAGFSWKAIQKEYYYVMVTGEFNKQLVGVDDNLDTDFEEAIINGGGEFNYNDIFAVRLGYIYDREGRVKAMTVGGGVSPTDLLQFDFSYIPSNTSSALANTVRFSLSVKP
jgi:hypothetical protein